MTPSVNRRSAAALFGLLAPMIVAPSLRVAAQEPLAPPVEEWVIERVTLDQAMGRALRASPQMAQALGAVDNAGSARRVAIGAFLPTLSLGTGAAFASADRLGAAVPGGTQTYSAGLSGSLDLFTGGRRIADLRRTGAQQRAADARLLEQRFQVVLVTKRAYFDALQADDVVRVAEAAVRRAEDGLVAAERRVRAGVAAPSDALRARLALTEARRLLAEGRSQQRVTAFALGRIVGADGAIGPEPIMDAAPRPLAIAESDLRALVLQEAPSVRAATADAGLAAAAASAARAAYLPSLRITGAYDWSAASASINAGAANWSVGIGLSYPL
ncbi:MAG: TolC family protein, partial [Gemmatimonadetes bacterium]|nr:TolC family protein [Gemmatimonadota bacterium]